MKICHVITRMIVGGAQENTLFSAQGASMKGHEVCLVTGPSPGPEGKLLEKVASSPSFPVTVCPDLVREISPLHDLKAYFFLKKFFSENKFDVVHTHSSKAGIIGRLAARAAGVPVVVHTIHGLAFNRYEKKWKNIIYVHAERIAAKSCDMIFSVAQAMIDQSLAQKVGRKDMYSVVYSGMELEKFLNSAPDAELKKSLNIPDDAVVVGTVARLFKNKGYEDLFRIAPDLVKANSRLHFLIVGDGEMRESLTEIARRGNFLDRISFAGLVPPDQVWRYTALMDILVHLSIREGLPRAAVQALGSGKPVVAYNLDGTPEVVKDGVTGRIVEPLNADEAGRAILELASDEAKRAAYGKNGRKLVESLFKWQDMSDRILSLYEECMSKKACGNK